MKNQGCCAAAPGSTAPGAAARLAAPTAGPRMPTTSSVSVWSASPRTLPLTLNPSIPQHSAVFNPGCWFAVVGWSAVDCSAMAPQAPGVFCISPWGAHAHFASLAQPHFLTCMSNRCHRQCIWPAVARPWSMVASEPLTRRHTASSKDRKNQAKTLKRFGGNCFMG